MISLCNGVFYFRCHWSFSLEMAYIIFGAPFMIWDKLLFLSLAEIFNIFNMPIYSKFNLAWGVLQIYTFLSMANILRWYLYSVTVQKELFLCGRSSFSHAFTFDSSIIPNYDISLCCLLKVASYIGKFCWKIMANKRKIRVMTLCILHIKKEYV